MELSKENQIADIKGLMSDLAQCIVDLKRNNSELLNLSNGNKVEVSKLAHDSALRSTQAAIESKFREYGVIQQIEQDQQKIEELEKEKLILQSMVDALNDKIDSLTEDNKQ